MAPAARHAGLEFRKTLKKKKRLMASGLMSPLTANPFHGPRHPPPRVNPLRQPPGSVRDPTRPGPARGGDNGGGGNGGGPTQWRRGACREL